MTIAHGMLLRDDWGGLAIVLTALVLLGLAGCWFGCRLIAAAAVSVWMARQALPDYRWAAKVVVYESVFLWVFCGFWGTLVSSFILFEEWISRLLGLPRFAGVGEVLTLFGGTGVLGLWWLIRYHVALRAIRWSNF